MKVLSLVERGGKVRSTKIDSLSAKTIRTVLVTNIDRASTLNTDEAKFYGRVGREFAAHGAVNHSAKEYARDAITTNTVEGFFSIFKGGMKGIYQHCSEDHLQRYLAKFDFRYSNRIKLGVDDVQRTELALRGAGWEAVDVPTTSCRVERLSRK